MRGQNVNPEQIPLQGLRNGLLPARKKQNYCSSPGKTLRRRAQRKCCDTVANCAKILRVPLFHPNKKYNCVNTHNNPPHRKKKKFNGNTIALQFATLPPAE